MCTVHKCCALCLLRCNIKVGDRLLRLLGLHAATNLLYIFLPLQFVLHDRVGAKILKFFSLFIYFACIMQMIDGFKICVHHKHLPLGYKELY
jgi:hypothetical protein